ncbi:MAG: AMP-binding protein, partial [Pseudomonadales bacterium]|nr:AMP-binding protein [Pseudomonadales bacterium]
MHAGKYADINPDRPAFVMASTGESVSYREYDNRTNQLAHLLRTFGLKRLDHYAIFMENNDRYLEACGAGERSGLYYTCINSYLKADELAYILNNSESKVVITSIDKAAIVLEAMEDSPNITHCLVVGGESTGNCISYEQAIANCPITPISDESLGTSMLY